MRKHLLITAVLLGFTSLAQEAQWTSIKDINPFIGTGGHGHTHPSAQAPFGMIQLGPNTRYEGWDGCSGYHFTDDKIFGFTCTHLSGTGVSDYGDLLMLPYSKRTKEGDHIPFDKASEVATAGYYAVTLNDGTTIEATAGDRSGMLRISYGAKEGAGLMIDLNFRDRVLDQRLTHIGDGMWEGHRISEGWAREQHFYFTIDLSDFSEEAELLNDGVWWLPLKEGRTDAIIRVAMSGTSEAGAMRNFKSELETMRFEEVKKMTEAKWEKELAKSRVKSASADDRAIYATALYHAYAVPNLWSDVDGTYRGADGTIYQDTVNRHYTVYSLWDTYRTAHPLYTITQSMQCRRRRRRTPRFY